MTHCIFCEIAAKRAPASIVYEDEDCLAFLDMRQPTEGHVLVIPRQHFETLDVLPLDLAAKLMEGAVRTARAMRRSLEPAGLSMWQSNGGAAGQEVPHVHLHLAARRPGDGLLRVYSTPPSRPDPETLERMAATIRAGFSSGERGD